MSTVVERCIDRWGLDSAAMEKGRRECIEAWKLISILSLQEEERRRIQNFSVRKLSSNLRPCDPILIPSYLGCSCCCCFERMRLNDPLLARQCRQCSSRGLTTMTSTPSLRRCCSGSWIRPKESAINLHNSGGGEGDEEEEQEQHRSTRMLLQLMGCSCSFT